jgi:WD40 repeat protein
MAEMKPIGIDQTTGQKRPVDTGDTVDVGDTIEIAVKQVFDYSGNVRNNVQALFPWENHQKIDDPATLPVGGDGVSWSPNGEFLAAGNGSSPYIHIYQRKGKTFNLLDPPGTLPTGSPNSLDWSSNGEFLAVGHTNSPWFTVYQRNGTVFTKIADPSTLPQGTGSPLQHVQGISWSPSGEFLSVTFDSNGEGPPFITYQRTGSTLTKLADPATLNIFGAGNAIAWAPNNEFLAIAYGGGDNIAVYQRSGTTFTKLSVPNSGGNKRGVAWSPDSQFLSIGHNGSPFFTNYQRTGTSFAILSDPATVPTSTQSGRDIAWSPNGKYVALTQQTTSPGLHIYERSGTTFTKITDPSTVLTSGATEVHWSPDGQFLAVRGSPSPWLYIYQTSGTLPDSGIVTIRGVIREGD